MNSRLGIALVLLLVPAAVVACGAVGEKLSVGSNTITSDGGEAGGGGTAEGYLADPFADGGVVLYETHFEGPDECAEWKATGATVTTVPGHTGNGCMICATTNEASMYVRRDVANLPEVQQGYYGVTIYSKVVSANGQLTVEALTSLDDQDGGPPLPSTGWDGDAATSNGTPTPGSGSYSTSWHGSGSTRNITEKRPGTVLGVYLLAGAETITPDGIGQFLPAGTCIAFDDLQVTFTAASQ